MGKAFHDHPFDPATKIKLEIFRHYVRKWLPVFLTEHRDGSKACARANIYDFFSGPGSDTQGNPGSPLIVQEEVKAYCQTRGHLKADVPVRMVFNDIEPENTARLQSTLQASKCPKECCSYEYHALPFVEALERYLPNMRCPGEANLVILDQCGITEVTPETVSTLVGCRKTDVIFFLSTSFLRRFAAEPEIRSKFDLPSDLAEIENNDNIHRYICEYYRDKLSGSGIELAPFSLKKGSNIYGVIFASASLNGLERFLTVCWKLDPNTGQANYNIDQDPTYGGQTSLFGEKPTKVDRFEGDLLRFVEENAPDNHALYRFCLEQGFPSAKANEALRNLAEKGKLRVLNAQDESPARKNSFYLTKDPHTVVFKSQQP